MCLLFVLVSAPVQAFGPLQTLIILTAKRHVLVSLASKPFAIFGHVCEYKEISLKSAHREHCGTDPYCTETVERSL